MTYTCPDCGASVSTDEITAVALLLEPDLTCECGAVMVTKG